MTEAPYPGVVEENGRITIYAASLAVHEAISDQGIALSEHAEELCHLFRGIESVSGRFADWERDDLAEHFVGRVLAVLEAFRVLEDRSVILETMQRLPFERFDPDEPRPDGG